MTEIGSVLQNEVKASAEKEGGAPALATAKIGVVKFLRLAEDLIAEDKLKREGFLNSKVVHKIWNDFTCEGGKYQPLIWYILMFEQWLSYGIM